MPDTITHILFAEEALVRMPDDIDSQAFYLGCIGPDPLYYYNLFPFANRRNSQETASAIHDSRIGPFIDKGREYVYKQTDPAIRHMLSSYLWGFIAHYILDSSAHPFIKLMSGEYRNGHKRFEMNIDTLLLYSLKNQDSKEFRFDRYMKPSWDLIRPAADMFGYIVANIYDDGFDKKVYINGIAHMRTVCGLFQDHIKILLPLTVAIESLLRRKGEYRYLFYRMPDRNAPDYMNMKKTVIKESFPEIFYKALDRFIDVYKGKIDTGGMDLDFSGTRMPSDP